MTPMTIPEILAAQAEIRRQVSEVDAAIAGLKEPPKPEKWVPKQGEWVWVVLTNWKVERFKYHSGWKNNHLFPDTPEGKRDAERAGLRIRSLQHGKPPFEKGQKVFYAPPGAMVYELTWDGYPLDRCLWYEGRIHATKEGADAWSAEFNEAWGGE